MDAKILHITNEIARKAKEHLANGRELCAGALIYDAFPTYADAQEVFTLLLRSEDANIVESVRGLVKTLFEGYM